MKTAVETLREIIREGLAIDIYQAEQAFALDRSIGSYADEVNRASFAALFGSLQGTLVRSAILSVTRLFEPINRRFFIYSIPTALQILEEETENLAIEQKHVVLQKLIEFGYCEETLEHLTDVESTRLIVKEFRRRLPGIEDSAGLSLTLSALKTTRDKLIAHREAVNAGSLPSTTYAEIDQLLLYAKKFVGTVGMGYLRVPYECSGGEYLLSRNVSTALKRLLKRASVIQ